MRRSLVCALLLLGLSGCVMTTSPYSNPMIMPPVVGYATPYGVAVDDPFEAAHDLLSVVEHGISAYGQYEGVKVLRDWRKGRLYDHGRYNGCYPYGPGYHPF